MAAPHGLWPHRALAPARRTPARRRENNSEVETHHDARSTCGAPERGARKTAAAREHASAAKWTTGLLGSARRHTTRRGRK
eukprot:11381047-Alexandrium_andersonii.AAC.1